MILICLLYLLRFKLSNIIIKIKTYFVCWSSAIKKHFLEFFIKVKTYPVCWSDVSNAVSKLSICILHLLIYWLINCTICMGDIDYNNYCDIYEQIRKLKKAIQQQQDFDAAMEALGEFFIILCIPILILGFFSRFNL